MAPFDNGYSSNLINKLSPLIEGQVPDFIQADHAIFVRFLKHYYQYLESGELRLTVSIDNMLLEVETKTFLLLEDGNKLVLESSVGKFSANETLMSSKIIVPCPHCRGTKITSPGCCVKCNACLL